jgi:hypothetical protein
MSATPIGEALASTESGQTPSVQNRGFRATDSPQPALGQLYDLWMQLEGPAVLESAAGPDLGDTGHLRRVALEIELRRRAATYISMLRPSRRRPSLPERRKAWSCVG